MEKLKSQKSKENLSLSPIASSTKTTLEVQRRWFTIEFIFYFLLMAFCLKKMLESTASLSNEQHPNYQYYKHKLSPGWIQGRQVDNSDSQYRKFRLGIVQLSALEVGYLVLSKIFHLSDIPRVHFQTIISAVILVALHGTSVLKIMVIISLNYVIARVSMLGFGFASNSSKTRALSCTLIWVFNLAILFANDYWDGYRFRNLWIGLDFLDNNNYRGLLPRWQIGFNISMLRLISYGMDYQWASIQESNVEKERAEMHRTKDEYGFQNYFNYIFYPPLYIAGPIITFNNFVSQINVKPITITRDSLIGYFIRFIICFLLLEFILHYMYVVAIKDAKAWVGDSMFELSVIGYWNLTIVWLKLLIPWRFFRFWALLDGIDPPENMVRCMTNNYSTLGFWRSWHRSYNLWIVRYIYIPLGGSNNMIISTILVFTFVALWHDLSFTLLTWGWLISFFVLPEIIARKFFEKSHLRNEWYFRYIIGFGGCFNILTMMSANLIGFSLGLDGVNLMWSQFLGSFSGFLFLIKVMFVFFCAVQIMIEYREEEARKSIYRKC
ncbi:MBOAT, membrane-bound O-acyltransferase family-domain-containing protein [Phakopsora pachyrhizi]|nr:MBOAT, membrane-bound O-acyltransferase family-domain-containing protein [Phakopsora pachyrhizi]